MKTKPLRIDDSGRLARISALVAGLVAAWQAALAAPAPDPGRTPPLIWRAAGPFRAGRVLAAAGAPDDKQRFYFGAVNGGVWRTEDAGRTWRPIADALPVGTIGAIAVAPSDPRTLYVGTGEADMRSDIAQGVGMFRSRDGGATWAAIGLRDSQQIGKILVDPRNPAVLLVAALGHPYGPNPERGVFRSTDGGAHWQRVLFHDADTGAIDLAAAPDDPNTIYAALWQTRRPPWNVYPPSSGPGSGLYKSTDGGQHWAPVTGHGFPAAPARIGLTTSVAAPARVYALVAVRDGDGGGLYRSDDRGGTWRRVSNDKRITERAWYFSGITANPANADDVTVCDTIVLHSMDGGAHFAPILGDPTGDDFHVLWIDPRDPGRRILGSDQGAQVSMNGGATWSSWFNQPTGQFYHVSTDNAFPYHIYGAQQDSGAASVPVRNDEPFDGISMREFREVAAGGEADNIAPDPDDPNIVFGGRVDRLDRRTGQVRNVDPTLAYPDAYREEWTLPLAWGPRDHALYFGNQRIFRTRDGGQHWAAISTDLTRDDPGTPPTLDGPTAADVEGVGKRRGVVYALGPSPLAANLLWAGTDDGRVWRSADDGATWQDRTPAGLEAWSKVGVVEPGHFDRDTAYLAIDRHRLDDAAPHLLRTHDGGAHWDAIVAGLPTGDGPDSADVIREDPQQPGLLYAGTERGFFVSFDDGDHWRPLQAGLPITSVRDIVVHGDDLVIATHGRGFYVLDDIAGLRTLAARPDAVGLLPPAKAVRLHPPDFTGTPMPREEPAAANPPAGAILEYVLAAPAKRVTLTVARDGEVLRRFASDDPPPKHDPATLQTAPDWIRTPPQLAATAGAHRFVWNLRLTVPDILKDGDAPPTPVVVPPGDYTVALTADGTTTQQTLHVVADPRLHLGADDLERQFTLARQIEAARVQCGTALKQAASLHTKPADAVVAAAAPGANGYPAAPDGLTGIADRLDRLALAVGGADVAPSPDAIEGFRLARAALDQALGRLQSLGK